jgi:Protein of unknown function (DUF4087)
MRCGWVHNPTPANWYLFDRDGRWVLSEQGLYSARGMERLPDFTETEWVKTNVGSYGYGCGCMRVSTDPGKRIVTRIHSAIQKPLSTCRADKRLPPP